MSLQETPQSIEPFRREALRFRRYVLPLRAGPTPSVLIGIPLRNAAIFVPFAVEPCKRRRGKSAPLEIVTARCASISVSHPSQGAKDGAPILLASQRNQSLG